LKQRLLVFHAFMDASNVISTFPFKLKSESKGGRRKEGRKRGKKDKNTPSRVNWNRKKTKFMSFSVNNKLANIIKF